MDQLDDPVSHRSADAAWDDSEVAVSPRDLEVRQVPFFFLFLSGVPLLLLRVGPVHLVQERVTRVRSFVESESRFLWEKEALDKKVQA